LTACWQESYTGGSKAKRILLPVRHLREWIEHNILLELATAPFSKEDATLVPEAGSCHDCPSAPGTTRCSSRASQRSTIPVMHI
jgi:ParB family chromosome partitioning protein